MINIYGVQALQKFMFANNVQELSERENNRIEEELKALSVVFSPVCQLVTQYQFIKGNSDGGDIQYVLAHHYPVLAYKERYLRPYNGLGSSPTYSLTLCENIDHNFLTYFSLPSRLTTRPPKIGKATVRKMDTWLEYLLEIEKLKKEYIEYKQKEIEDFKNILRTYAGGLKWDVTKNSGEIERGGIQYVYNIDANGGIAQKLSLPFRREDDIRTFMDISENLYKKTNPEVFLLYSCDAWHSKESQNLIGIFSSKEKLELYTNELKTAGALNDNDLHQLRTIGQTQGLTINYMIKILPLNPLFVREEKTEPGIL